MKWLPALPISNSNRLAVSLLVRPSPHIETVPRPFQVTTILPVGYRPASLSRIAESAHESFSSLVTHPSASRLSVGPLPYAAPVRWEIHAREVRNTSTNGHSVVQSTGAPTFTPRLVPAEAT